MRTCQEAIESSDSAASQCRGVKVGARCYDAERSTALTCMVRY